MKFKGIELNGTYKFEIDKNYFYVYDEKGNSIYSEHSNGTWFKSEYDEKGNTIYYENNNEEWYKREFDEKGNCIYFENTHGKIIDKRVKEMTVKEIEELLGHKIKIKGE